MIRPVTPPRSPLEGRPRESEEPASNVVQLHTSSTPHFSPLPPAAESPPESGDKTVSVQAPATPEAEPLNLSDSARRRLELQKQMEAELEAAKKSAQQRDSSTSMTGEAGKQTMVSLQASPKSATAAAPSAPVQDAAKRPVRDETKTTGGMQNTESRKRRRWLIVALVALNALFIAIVIYGGRDSISASMMGQLLASASVEAPSTSASTTSATTAKTTATAKPSTTSTPTLAAPISSGSGCVPVTQAWIDVQPWATDRSGNDISKFSVRNWPKSLNCGKNDNLMKWIDAKSVDISNCCQ